MDRGRGGRAPIEVNTEPGAVWGRARDDALRTQKPQRTPRERTLRKTRRNRRNHRIHGRQAKPRVCPPNGTRSNCTRDAPKTKIRFPTRYLSPLASHGLLAPSPLRNSNRNAGPRPPGIQTGGYSTAAAARARPVWASKRATGRWISARPLQGRRYRVTAELPTCHMPPHAASIGTGKSQPQGADTALLRCPARAPAARRLPGEGRTDGLRSY